MKEFLQNLISSKKDELENLKKRNEESNDLQEVRSLASQINNIVEEIRDAQTQLNAIVDEEKKADNEERKFDPTKALNVVASARQNSLTAKEAEENPRATMEYRKAFKNFIQRGETNRDVLLFEERANSTGTSADLGVLIPTTIVQKIITGAEKVYGQLYSRVRKTNIKGGVKYPIGSFNAVFKRVSETTVSDRQKAGESKGSVVFTYKMGEIRLARTLLETILSVDAFEDEFAKVIIKAYVKAMDTEIMVGSDDNEEMEGILTEADKTESRIPAENIISFTETEMKDWKSWQEKLFAKIPLSMRGLNPEFAMTANTYEANIKTLADENNRPVYNETYNPVDGTEISKFKGKDVAFVEEDILKNFNDAKNGDYFGMYWVPEEAYAVNSNLEFLVADYLDHDTNQVVKKAIVINDGKVLDPKYIYLLKKEVKA